MIPYACSQSVSAPGGVFYTLPVTPKVRFSPSPTGGCLGVSFAGRDAEWDGADGCVMDTTGLVPSPDYWLATPVNGTITQSELPDDVTLTVKGTELEVVLTYNTLPQVSACCQPYQLIPAEAVTPLCGVQAPPYLYRLLLKATSIDSGFKATWDVPSVTCGYPGTTYNAKVDVPIVVDSYQVNPQAASDPNLGLILGLSLGLGIPGLIAIILAMYLIWKGKCRRVR